MTNDLLRSVPFTLSRASENGDGLTLDGYAAVFDTPTRIDSWEGTFDEKIKRGAFKKTISERTPVMQFDHGAHPLIGSIPIGNITELKEDSQGLHVVGRLSDNWLIQPVRDAIASGSVDGMSFRFQVVREEWRTADGKLLTDPDEIMERLYFPGDDDPLVRTLTEVRMQELGPVVFPAYKETSVSVRADGGAAIIRTDEDMRRKVRQSLATGKGNAPFPDPKLREEIARALLFDAPVTTGDEVKRDAPADDSHPSNESRNENDAPLPTDEHPSEPQESEISRARVQRDAEYMTEYLALIMKGSEKYDRSH